MKPFSTPVFSFLLATLALFPVADTRAESSAQAQGQEQTQPQSQSQSQSHFQPSSQQKQQQGLNLAESMAQAYQSNPALLAQRAQLRALDEKVVDAKSGYRPQIDIVGGAGFSHQGIPDSLRGDKELRPRSAGLQVTQSVFKGFRNVAAVRAAEAEVLAGRAVLQDAEQTLFYDVGAAYLKLFHAQKVFKLRQSNEEVLGTQLSAAQSRFKVGEITQTDVDQARARLERAKSLRVRAAGDVEANRAVYARLVGAEKDLIGSLPTPVLPSDEKPPQNLEDAIALALAQNPRIAAAKQAQQAAENNVDIAVGRLMPEVNLVGTAMRAWDQTTLVRDQTEVAQIMAQVTIPVSHGGIEFAKARAAKQIVSARRLDLEEARLRVREATIKAWTLRDAAQAAIEAEKAQVSSAENALHGVRQENKVGTRTTLDVLNAEQEVLDSKVGLAEAERDALLACLALRASLGTLLPAHLKLAAPSYDPRRHYDSVTHKWYGFGSDEE